VHPLERAKLVTILPAMLRDRLLRGVWIGLVAAAATAGALVGFGWVRGAPLQPLNTVAHVLVGSRAFYVHDAHPLVTPAGLLVHGLSLVVAGMLFSVLAGGLRGVGRWVAAVVFAAAVAAFDFLLLPSRLAPGFETVLTRGEVVMVYAVLAAAIAVAADMTGRNEERGTTSEEI
jgi:hypothetical protein